MKLLNYIRWRYQKRKFHLKDETELSQKEQKELREIEISQGLKIKVKDLDKEENELNRRAKINGFQKIQSIRFNLK